MATTVEGVFFQLTSGLTGGVIDDLGTAIAGGISLLIILAGLDYLKGFFEVTMLGRAAGKNFVAAERYRAMRDSSDSGSMEHDYYNALYRKHLSTSVGISAKTGKYFSPNSSFGSDEVLEDSLTTQSFEADGVFDDDSSEGFEDAYDPTSEGGWTSDDVGIDRDAFWDDDRMGGTASASASSGFDSSGSRLEGGWGLDDIGMDWDDFWDDDRI